MLKYEWENILKGQEIRQSLSKIRQEIKDSNKLQLLHNIVKGNEEILIELLKSEEIGRASCRESV